MEPRLQRRVQRYGWDMASADYEPLWQAQLAPAHAATLELAALRPGQTVLDVACGTGLVSLAAARAVGPQGQVIACDLSGRMVDAARQRARDAGIGHLRVARMDAECLDLPDGSVDVALCALGLMYLPDPGQALREMRRVLRPGGHVVLSVWGERARCGWAPLFPIVDAEVASEVCPLFFALGQRDALARLCERAGLAHAELRRIESTLDYGSGSEACRAAFVGGPVALAWSRFAEAARARVRTRYLQAIAAWRVGRGYRVPGEFVIVRARVPDVLSRPAREPLPAGAPPAPAAS